MYLRWSNVRKGVGWAMATMVGLLLAVPGNATHIRAGEIIMELIDCADFRYRIEVIGYVDLDSDVEFGDGFIDLGIGVGPELLRSVADSETFQFIRNVEEERIAKVTFIINSVSYPGPGTYLVGYQEENRNDGTLNVPNSVNTPFYVETQIRIDPFLFADCNNTPVLTIPPVDVGGVGVQFFHNPGAFDPDGDSLAFRLVVPKRDFDLPIPGYVYPDVAPYSFEQEDGTRPPILEINPRTGDLLWDAPGQAGQYNITFIVEEWRRINGIPFLMGYVTRDMQILVIEATNGPPEIESKELCVEAGTLVQETITATDPISDRNPVMDPVKVDAFGQPFEFNPFGATWTFGPTDENGFMPSPATGTFVWQTDCSQVREEPYVANFRVEDNPIGEDRGPSFTRFGSLEVTIVAPAPEMTGAAVNDGTVDVDWQPYSCGNVQSLDLYRRFGQLNYTPDECETGIPGGFKLIGELDPAATSFNDDFDGGRVPPGTTVCYRLVASYPEPQGGESIVSNEVCVEIEALGPVITKVSVVETDPLAGEIDVEWVSGFDLDPAVNPGPYTYQLYRGEGFSTPIDGQTFVTTVGPTSDQTMTFRDTGLNTEAVVYNYTVTATDANDQPLENSANASAVRLGASPANNSITLLWTAETPWNNLSTEFPTFDVYRNRTDAAAQDENTFVRIATVPTVASGLSYTDEGTFGGNPLQENTEYCYYVETRGIYEEPSLPRPLINLSNIACSTPRDEDSPCSPLGLTIVNASLEDCQTFLADKPCAFRSFANNLDWESPNSETDTCDLNLIGYNIYFSRSGAEDEYEFLDFTPLTQYTHQLVTGFKGCYRITTVDASGNESPPSAPVCNDNCPNYELPNVVTLNGDSFNDTFEAFPGRDNEVPARYPECPRFVEGVEIEIVNRWGDLVYTYESGGEKSIYIEWDGIGNTGRPVSSGVYYYNARVTFDVLDPANQVKEMKGWIHVLGQ